MTDGTGDKGPPPAVGYRRPPTATQFKKGRSGNPGGRPRKTGPAVLDMAALLNAPVKLRHSGRVKTVEIKDVQLRAMVKEASTGNVDAIAYCFEQFARYGAIVVPELDEGGAVHIPKTMPMKFGTMLLGEFGRPTEPTVTGTMTWTAEQIACLRAAYLASRSDEERAEDIKIGYPDLDEQ